MSDYEWTVEVMAPARTAISREIRSKWDGRELCGALVGYVQDARIIVTDAGGIGVGARTPSGETWIKPSRSRWFQFAQSCDAELVGDWHSHPGDDGVEPSRADVNAWQRTRDALRSPVYLGLIFSPRRVRMYGINYSEPGWSFAEPNVAEYLVEEAGYVRTKFTLLEAAP